MKVLVVGAGSIGKRHHGNLLELGADATLRGWRGYELSGFEAEVAEYDAVVIATATEMRLPLIQAAVDAGKPLYIEKPLAATLQEVEAIEAICGPVADRSVLGYMMRYHPAFRALAQADLSDVFQFSLTIGHDVTQWRQNWKFSESYAARPEGGGVLLDLCHEIDMASCLFPDLSVVDVQSHGHAAYEGVDMASRISLRGANVSGEVTMDYLTPRLHRRAILRGVDRCHDFDFAAQNYRLSDLAGERSLDLPLERNAMFLSITRDFLALAAGKPASDVEHLPRLDLALPSAKLTAKARAARQFIATIAKEIP